MTTTVFTLGHSNKSFEALAELLSASRVELVVDVRRYPSSRRHPHFNRGVLEELLAENEFGYRHAPELGGHREARDDSPHAALEGAFRGYADHMASREFQAAVEELLELGRAQSVAVMCAEKDPAHCHRSLLADELVERGAEVLHLVEPGRSQRHRPHPARTRDAEGRAIYASPGGAQLDLYD